MALAPLDELAVFEEAVGVRIFVGGASVFADGALNDAEFHAVINKMDEDHVQQTKGPPEIEPAVTVGTPGV